MIPIKEAVESAVTFAQGVLEPVRTGAILLEEVEARTANGRDVWLITLSLPDPSYPMSFSAGHRQYKTFTADGQTGEVLSMKIRQLSTAA
jgi:hypothetical protein